MEKAYSVDYGLILVNKTNCRETRFMFFFFTIIFFSNYQFNCMKYCDLGYSSVFSLHIVLHRLMGCKFLLFLLVFSAGLYLSCALWPQFWKQSMTTPETRTNQ